MAKKNSHNAGHANARIKTILPEPLTSSGFAPFGEVITHVGDARRHSIDGAFDHDRAAAPALWVSRIDSPHTLPVEVCTLERHPFSTQVFFPLRCRSYLVIVCGATGTGEPDVRTARAFLASGTQGVAYRRNVWHGELTVLDETAEFAIMMAKTDGEDTLYYRLPSPIRVETQAPTHHRDFVGYAARRPDPEWPNGARLALNICVNVEEGSEPSVPDGDPTSETGLVEVAGGDFNGRDLAAESMFEFGSRVGFWRIDRLLAERNLPATIFACALALERNLPICEAIRDRGYDTCAHGWRWERHQTLTETEERDRIARAVETIRRLTGSAPAGWYCRYGPSLNTRRLLAEHGGFAYDSDAYNDELPYWTEVLGRQHLVVPYSLAANDAKFIRGGLATGDDFFALLRDSVDFLLREGRTQPSMMSVGLHLRLAGHPARAAGLERFLDYVTETKDVWVCRRVEIAAHWRSRFPPVEAVEGPR